MTQTMLTRLVIWGLVSALGLSAADAVIGTWVLDVKKSDYRPGPPPKSQTRVYRESAEGITATVVTVNASGKVTTAEYPVNYDGHPHAVTGSTDIDVIQMTKISNSRAESILMHAGKVLAKAVREVSGATLTITYEGKAADGETIKNLSRYDRQ